MVVFAAIQKFETAALEKLIPKTIGNRKRDCA